MTANNLDHLTTAEDLYKDIHRLGRSIIITQPPGPLITIPTHYYTLDTSGGAASLLDSLNTNPLNIQTGSAAAEALTKLGGSFYNDGDDILATSATEVWSSPWSVSFWLLALNSLDGAVMSAWDASSARVWSFECSFPATSYLIASSTGASTPTNQIQWNTVAASSFKNYVIRYTGTQLEIYINTHLYGSTQVSLYSGACKLYLGKGNLFFASYPTECVIDELGVWKNYALTNFEINQLYNNNTGKYLRSLNWI